MLGPYWYLVDSLTMDLRIYGLILCMTSSVTALGVTLLNGDVYIQFVGAFYLEPDGSCKSSSIESETVQNLHAIKWTLSKLNENNYINGVNIGLLVEETCLKPDEDKRVGLDIARELQDGNGKNIVGLIGPDYSSETESISRLISSLPQEYHLLQLGFSATSSSLNDRSVFKNFFRTIPPDDVQVEVMHEFITRLNWTYIAILYYDDVYGKGGMEALLQSTEGLDVCFPARISISHQENTVVNLETILKDNILGAEVPISGVLIFGTPSLVENVLLATENILQQNEELQPPVFLFSEAGNDIVERDSNVSRGAFVLSPRTKFIGEFQNYWKGLFTDFRSLYKEVPGNKWLQDLYNTKFDCSLASNEFSNTCPLLSSEIVDKNLPNSKYNQYAIQAALVIAKTTKEVIIDNCGSEILCSNFNDASRNDFIEKLNTMSIKFDDDFENFRLPEFQDPDLVIEFNGTCEAIFPNNFPLYEVQNQHYDKASDTMELTKIAEYFKGNAMVLNTQDVKDYDKEGNELSWPDIRKPQCPDGNICSKCLDVSVDQSVLFIPGDMYVVGIAPVHSKGLTPLYCGGIKSGGVDIVETIRFAVKEAIVKPNAKIGVIVIDSCNDPQIIQEKILTLHKFGVLINGEFISVRDKILGYIGGWTSDVSKAVADITTRLRNVQVSYASTATVLSKRNLYPFFLRTPTPDDEQAEILLKITQEFDANFIQILYSESEYGEGGRDMLLHLIESEYNEICVSQTIPVSTTRDANEIVKQLRNSPNAKVVVSFLGSEEINHIVSTLNTLTRNEFLIISSEGWGTRFDLSAYSNLIGTITVSSELTINEKFKDHMKSLSPEGTDVDPWIRSYIEEEFDCYFEWSFNKTSRQKCQGEERLDVYTSNYRIDTWSPFAERAVISLLYAAKQVLEAKCGGTNTLCEEFKQDPGAFAAQLETYRYQEDTQSVRIYNNNGDGTAGYTIYTVTLDQTGHYKRIGIQEPGAFTFQKSVYNNIRGEIINSSCSSGVKECNVCFPTAPTVEDSEGLSTSIIVVIALLGVVCCALGAILLFICNRNGFCIKIENGRVKLTSPYLTPIYRTDRNLHGIDGSDQNTGLDNNYDSIPPSSLGYGRSNSSLSAGRMPVSDGSSSSADRGTSGGSTSGIMSRQGSSLSGNGFGRDNPAFNNEQRQMQSFDRGSGSAGSSEQGYLSATPPPHTFIKPLPAAPPSSSNVVFQPDGSYITATVQRQEPGNVVSHTDVELQMSGSSDNSVGYLGKQKVADV